MGELEEIADQIKKRDQFLLLGHIDPDGDCIGSLFSLKWILDKLGKRSLVLLDEVPVDYDFLEIIADDYRLFTDFNLLEKESDRTIITLDSGDRERLGQGKDYLDFFPVFNLDHHVDNTEFGDLNYIDPNKAAAAVIVYELADKLDIELDIKIGQAIVMGIIADTGSFRYSNTSPLVLNIVADLLEKGVDIYKINQMLYGRNSYESVVFKGLALSTIQKSEDGKIAWISAADEIFARSGLKENDSMGIVNYARDIKGVEVGISFTERKEDEIKVSLRSNNYVPVNEIAAVFSGGGHPRAAGCKIKGELDQVREKVLKEVERYV